MTLWGIMLSMRQLIRGGVLMQFTSSCVCWCAIFLVVWGLGAGIKQLCALWTWATSASWQAVTQSQQRCTHATHGAYGHDGASTQILDTHTSLTARGTLFWLHRSHTQPHPPPDWMWPSLSLRTRWVVIRCGGRLLLPSSPPSLNCPGLTARLMSVT